MEPLTTRHYVATDRTLGFNGAFQVRLWRPTGHCKCFSSIEFRSTTASRTESPGFKSLLLEQLS
jgi:hypothetical protein